MTVVPSAAVAAIIKFSVAPTLGKSRYTSVPMSRSASATIWPCSISTLAPSSRKAFRCKSSGREPIAEPPGVTRRAATGHQRTQQQHGTAELFRRRIRHFRPDVARGEPQLTGRVARKDVDPECFQDLPLHGHVGDVGHVVQHGSPVRQHARGQDGDGRIFRARKSSPVRSGPSSPG